MKFLSRFAFVWIVCISFALGESIYGVKIGGSVDEIEKFNDASFYSLDKEMEDGYKRYMRTDLISPKLSLIIKDNKVESLSVTKDLPVDVDGDILRLSEKWGVPEEIFNNGDGGVRTYRFPIEREDLYNINIMYLNDQLIEIYSTGWYFLYLNERLVL